MNTALDADVLSPAAIAAVEDALRSVAKALRSMQLYLPNNPTRANALEQARLALGSVWKYADPLEVRINETSLLWEDRVVYDDTERGSEGLPWLMYRDGLRVLTLRSGFDVDGLDALLGVFLRARSTAPDDDDLVTLLWVADLPNMSYSHVESDGAVHGSGAMDALTVATDRTGDREPLGAPAAESTPVGDGPPPGMLRVEDFDSTLYFLDARETAYLQDEVRREYAEDPRKPAVAVLFDVIAMPVDRESRLEAMRVVDQLVLEFLASSDFEMVALVLRDAASTRARMVHEPAITASLAALPARLSEPAVMAQLLQALDESSRTLSAGLLESLFGELHATALRSMLAWLGVAQNSPARVGVERATLRLAAANTAELARQLDSDDDAVVHGALQVATSLATPAAVPPLTRLLANADPAVRGAAVAALREIGTPGAMHALETCIDDAVREVRVLSLRAIATRRHAPALPKLQAALRRKDLRSADLGEKMVLFEAFGTLCGDAGIPTLDGLLNARSLIGAREPTEIRACAARALGLVGTDPAIRALQRAADSKDLVVRSAVSRAMRGGA